MILEIFKAGTHTDSKGTTKTFSEADLDNIVDTYKPEEREAPLVLGHPKDNDPAFGWVEKLYRKGKSLFAKTKDEDPSFLQAVKDRKFPKRSISLTEDGRLNHIGFLGAVLPAVDGLAEIKFNKDENFSVIEINEKLNFEFEDNAATSENESGDTTNNNSTSNNQKHKKPSDPKNPSPDSLNFVLQNISKTLDYIKDNTLIKNEDKLSREEKEKISRQLDLINLKLNTRNFSTILSEKVTSGHLTPLMKTKISSIIEFIGDQNFSEADNEKFSMQLKSRLIDFVNSIPRIVDISEFAEKPDDEPDTNLVDDDYGGLAVDQASNSLHKKVLRKMKEKNIPYLSALKLASNNS